MYAAGFAPCGINELRVNAITSMISISHTDGRNGSQESLVID
jgi:hypothetical protein